MRLTEGEKQNLVAAVWMALLVVLVGFALTTLPGCSDDCNRVVAPVVQPCDDDDDDDCRDEGEAVRDTFAYRPSPWYKPGDRKR